MKCRKRLRRAKIVLFCRACPDVLSVTFPVGLGHKLSMGWAISRALKGWHFRSNFFFFHAPRARVKISTQEQTDTNRILREFMWRLHEDPGLPPGNPPPNFIPPFT